LDPLSHQPSDRQQVAELQRCDQIASNPLVRRRRPGSVEAGRTLAQQRLGGGKSATTTGTDDRLGAAAATAGSAERRCYPGNDSVQNLHTTILRRKDRRVARCWSKKRQGFVTQAALEARPELSRA
jgi:hypothetical protein